MLKEQNKYLKLVAFAILASMSQLKAAAYLLKFSEDSDVITVSYDPNGTPDEKQYSFPDGQAAMKMALKIIVEKIQIEGSKRTFCLVSVRGFGKEYTYYNTGDIEVIDDTEKLPNKYDSKSMHKDLELLLSEVDTKTFVQNLRNKMPKPERKARERKKKVQPGEVEEEVPEPTPTSKLSIRLVVIAGVIIATLTFIAKMLSKKLNSSVKGKKGSEIPAPSTEKRVKPLAAIPNGKN